MPLELKLLRTADVGLLHECNKSDLRDKYFLLAGSVIPQDQRLVKFGEKMTS